MAGQATVDITITTDADKAEAGFTDAARAADKLGTAVDQASRKVDTGADRMSSAADAADDMEGKAAKATGALGALSSGFELVGLGAFADGLNQAAMATDFASGAMDSFTLLTELNSVAAAKNKAATIASSIATRAQAAATKAAAVAQRVFNLAMAASPLLLAVAAVTLLVAGFVMLYRRSDTFRRLVDKLWSGIQAGVKAAAGVLKSVFKAAWSVVSTYVKVYAAIVKAVFSVVMSVARTVGRVLGGIFPADAARKAMRGVEAALTAPFKAAQRIIRGIASGLSNVFDAAIGGLMSALNVAIRALNSLIRGMNKVPGVDIPQIPEVSGASARGGAAMVPVARYASPSVSARGGVPGTTAAAPAVVINVSGALDPENVARQIRRILNGHERRVGLRVT